jgi:hypothetical protein
MKQIKILVQGYKTREIDNTSGTCKTVNLCLDLIKHQAMKTYGEVVV